MSARPVCPGYPIPAEARTNPPLHRRRRPRRGRTSGDRHMLIIDRDRWLLYRAGPTSLERGAGEVGSGSGAVFDLSANGRRPEGWTSADAAGLAVFPGLVRYDEVADIHEIRHAFRVTTRATNGHVWPASHAPARTQRAADGRPAATQGRPRDISGSFAPDVQKIFRAMKRYGLIVADNGSDMYISGTMDDRWNNDVLNPAFARVDRRRLRGDPVRLGTGDAAARAWRRARRALTVQATGNAGRGGRGRHPRRSRRLRGTGRPRVRSAPPASRRWASPPCSSAYASATARSRPARPPPVPRRCAAPSSTGSASPATRTRISAPSSTISRRSSSTSVTIFSVGVVVALKDSKSRMPTNARPPRASRATSSGSRTHQT